LEVGEEGRDLEDLVVEVAVVGFPKKDIVPERGVEDPGLEGEGGRREEGGGRRESREGGRREEEED
jgi:hypothetical protein